MHLQLHHYHWVLHYHYVHKINLSLHDLIYHLLLLNYFFDLMVNENIVKDYHFHRIHLNFVDQYFDYYQFHLNQDHSVINYFDVHIFDDVVMVENNLLNHHLRFSKNQKKNKFILLFFVFVYLHFEV
jgi:hypothetical protein